MFHILLKIRKYFACLAGKKRHAVGKGKRRAGGVKEELFLFYCQKSEKKGLRGPNFMMRALTLNKELTFPGLM